MRGTVAQCIEHISKTTQTFVDGLSFLETLSICGGATSVKTLGTRKIA